MFFKRFMKGKFCSKKLEGFDIQIGRFMTFKKLSRENVPKIFQIMNDYTVSKPYQRCPERWRNAELRIGKPIIYRPNHNGTHSCRQARLCELLHDLFQKKGNLNAKEVGSTFSDVEFCNILLAGYLLTSGRVDESSQSSGDYEDKKKYVRSGLVYYEYAKQLSNISKDLKKQTSRIISFACFPIDVIEKMDKDFHDLLFSDSKMEYTWRLLTISHFFDLVRCFDGVMSKYILPRIKNFMKVLININNNSNEEEEEKEEAGEKKEDSKKVEEEEEEGEEEEKEKEKEENKNKKEEEKKDDDHLNPKEKDNLDLIIDEIVQYSIELCKITGSEVKFNPKKRMISYTEDFIENSLDSELCWRNVSSLKFPDWDDVINTKKET